MGKTLKDWLARWKYDEAIKMRAQPLLLKIDKGDIGGFESDLRKLVEEILHDVRRKVMAGETADAIFTLLSIYASDRKFDQQLSAAAQGLLSEGMLFHDLGTQFGPNIEWMEERLGKLGRVPPRVDQ